MVQMFAASATAFHPALILGKLDNHLVDAEEEKLLPGCVDAPLCRSCSAMLKAGISTESYNSTRGLPLRTLADNGLCFQLIHRE